MNGTKLNIGSPHSGIHWSDIELKIRRGNEIRAETIGNWIGLGWKSLLQLVKPGTNGNRVEDRAARRLRLQEFVADPSKGFFWPRLSWIANEGMRLVSADERRTRQADGPGSKPRVPAGHGNATPSAHRAIGG